MMKEEKTIIVLVMMKELKENGYIERESFCQEHGVGYRTFLRYISTIKAYLMEYEYGASISYQKNKNRFIIEK